MLTYFRPPRARLLGSEYYRKVLATAPGAYWPLWEAGQPTAESLIKVTATEDLVSGGDFENAGLGIQTFAGWRDRAGTGAIASDAAAHGGSAACKLTRGSDNNLWIFQDVKVVPGSSLALSFWSRGDGSVAGRYAAWDLHHSAWVKAMTTTGNATTNYAQVTDTLTVPAACTELRLYMAGPTAAGSVYFDDVVCSGANTLDGAYAYGTEITFGGDGIGDGRSAPLFSGTLTHVLIGGPRFNALWNGNLGSAIAWGKMSAAQWSNTDEFRYLFHPKSSIDADTYCVFGKFNVANQVFWRRKMGSGKATNEQTYTFSPAITGWFCMGYTWDTSTPRLKGYVYAPGAVPFTEAFTIAGTDVDAWGTNPLDDQNCVLMAGAMEAQEWTGYGAHVAYWPGIAFTAAQMEHVMTL